MEENKWRRSDNPIIVE